MKIETLKKIKPNNITDEIYSEISKLGLSNKLIKKCSSLLIMQLDYIIKNNLENVFKIIHEINSMENDDKSSRTKPETPFRKNHLKGLYHKHYEGTGLESLEVNIRNHLKKNNIQTDFGIWLKDYLKKNKEKNTFLDDMDFLNISRKFSEAIIYDSFNKKASSKTLTGHWIIYAKNNNNNYYLCISRHSNSISDDLVIRNKIDETCISQFPFLKDILSIHS